MMVVFLACLIADPTACKQIKYQHFGPISLYSCAAAVRQARAMIAKDRKWRIEHAKCIRSEAV
jgi:hypothetical protein